MNTLEYAKNELDKYSRRVFGERVEVVLECTRTGHPFDDVIEIEVERGKGKITGSNERAVLIGVYKFFYELGCRFVRPGPDGEKLVRKSLDQATVYASYRPQNRYRGICSEGAISEENVTDMIEWLPKVGMNSYFLQFVDGHLFFEKWYLHKESSVLSPEEYSVEESEKHYAAAVEAAKLRGLILQLVGHGWTTEPLGYVTYGETRTKDEEIKPEDRELFALVNGKRGFFKEMPGDTQICCSNPKARGYVTDAIVEYLKGHPETDILHFWEADGINNHCECEECQKRLPSEWYVTMLNELDEKLTAENIDAKIVFLIYCDLLFAPKDVRLRNPDRFIMMYAPIARNYNYDLYTDESFAEAKTVDLQYKRNENRHPVTGGEYLYFLKDWQSQIECDSFVFDYHLMTFQHGGDPSMIKISRTLYEDMKNLRKAGLNGNVSCQLQRIFLPTALPNYVMAEQLFESKCSFEEIEEECLQAEYGEQYKAVRDFLHKTEDFFLSKGMTSGDMAARAEALEQYEKVLDIYERKLEFVSEDETVKRSLKNLAYFFGVQRLFVATCKKKAAGEKYEEDLAALNRFVDENELAVQPDDDCLFRKDGFKAWL